MKFRKDVELPERLRGDPGKADKPLWLPCDRCGKVRPITATEIGLVCSPCNPDTARYKKVAAAVTAKRQETQKQRIWTPPQPRRAPRRAA